MAGPQQLAGHQWSPIATGLRGLKTDTEVGKEELIRGVLTHFPDLSHFNPGTDEGYIGYAKQMERLLIHIKIIQPGCKTSLQYQATYFQATAGWQAMSQEERQTWADDLRAKNIEWWQIMMTDEESWRRILCIFLFHSLDHQCKREMQEVMKVADPRQRYHLLLDKLRKYVKANFRNTILLELLIVQMEIYPSEDRIAWRNTLNLITKYMDEKPNYRCQGDKPLKAIITEEFPGFVQNFQVKVGLGQSYSIYDLFTYINSVFDNKASVFPATQAVIDEERETHLWSCCRNDFASTHEWRSDIHWRKWTIACGM